MRYVTYRFNGEGVDLLHFMLDAIDHIKLFLAIIKLLLKSLLLLFKQDGNYIFGIFFCKQCRYAVYGKSDLAQKTNDMHSSKIGIAVKSSAAF